MRAENRLRREIAACDPVRLPERAALLASVTGDRIVACAGRPAAVAREALAAVGIDAEVIERPCSCGVLLDNGPDQLSGARAWRFRG